MKLRQRKSQPGKKYEDIDEDYIDVDYEREILLLDTPVEKREKLFRNTLQYQVQESHQSQEEEPSHQETESNSYSLINLQIEVLISRKLTQQIELDEEDEDEDEDNESEKYVYLAKFKNKSYYRCKWLTENELSEYSYELNSTNKNRLMVRMSKFKRMRLGEKQHFNPNFLVPDRILNSTDIFSAIHHKKANQIKGTWHEPIQIICNKILNFEKNSFPYGTLMIDEISTLKKEEPSQQADSTYSIQIIMNRLYFCFYKNYQEIWLDIGKAINKFIKDYAQTNADYFIVGNTIKQAALFLYVQWYILSLERFKREKEEFQNSINLTVQDESIIKVRRLNSTQSKYCNTNVFLNEKRAQKPKSLQELDQLNPGTLSFAWLNSTLSAPLQYEYINIDDMKQLDVNIEVDRFYLIKWKELSYSECTWERQSIFGHPEKVEEYRNINKMPNKQVREGLEVNLRIHNDLMQFYIKNQELLQRGRMRKPPTIEVAEQRLYQLKKRTEKPAKEYKGKDVITFKNYKLLKDFQNESLNWFIKNWYENRNTILADEMGLGKTIQIIAFLYHLYMYEKVLGPFLVLAPLTTLPQWRREIESWTNFNCLLYYDEGKAEGRSICQSYEFHYLHTKRNGDLVQSNIPKFQILLTNYENYLKDFDSLKGIAFQHIVIDEAHKMKNVRSQLSQALRQLPCQRKTLLTGTPIQNNTKELWSLLNYIQPRNFADQQTFIKHYGSMNTENEVANLKRMLKPFLLRRVKQDVQKLIPKLSEIIIDVEMTKLQKTIYKSILEKNKGDIIRGLSSANFNNIAIQFRKCCNHPFLISHDLENQLLADCKNQKQINEKFESVSGKMILLQKLLSKFKQQKKKTLIFSQFVIMLNLLEEFLEKNGYHSEMLHGGIAASDRHRAITRFSEDGEVDVFLISTKAGGVGINLTAATEIIIFDSDWNPQNDIQATARAHRIGQRNEVTVYRLITANSYESEMFQIAARKLGMDKAIFNGDFFKTSKTANGAEFEQAMSKAEIETLLKKGVLGFLQNSANEQDFFKQDIDQILQKNARKVQYSLAGDKNYTYSKSKFVGDSTSKGLDINSSNFWEVALKDIESPIQKLAKKFDTTTGFQDLAKQEQLMLETMQAVSDFVRIRVAGSAFNAQDERILFKFLGKISQSRVFNREYRQIADKLVEEIEKPSRRFKVTVQEIKAVIGGNRQDQIQNESQQPEEESNRHQQSSDVEESSSKQKKRKKSSNGKEERKPKAERKQFKRIPIEQDEITNLRADYEKVCIICLKPKCSIFCAGICKRSFHKLCWRRFLNGDSNITPAIQLNELGMDFQDWMAQLDRNRQCPTCQNSDNVCICSICGKEGTLDEYERSSQSMAKCKRENCDRFYHLKCLSESEEFSRLVHEANRRNGGQQGIYIDRLNCPVHLCYGCGERISKSTWLSLHSCVKCCRAYHPKCLNLARGYHHLNQTYYICQDHLSKPVRLALQNEYKLFDSDKKNIKELKKIQKSAKLKHLQKLRMEKLEEMSPEDPYSYEDFDLPKINEFDYTAFDSLWCRYCGSRFAEDFCSSPWGEKKLCLHHSKLWKKGKLDLSEQVDQPSEPISRRQTEIKYLNKLSKEKNIAPLALIDYLISTRVAESVP